MHYIVYQTTNKINGKIYIGVHQTENLNDGYIGSGKILKRAILKYGEENFERTILFDYDNSEEMFKKEKEVVELGPHSYNLKEGGNGGWDHVQKTRTPEQQYEISKLGGLTAAGRGVKTSRKFKLGIFDPKIREKNSVRMKGNKLFLGKFHTENTRKKMSASHTGKHSGKKNSQYGTCWIYHPQYGNKKIDKKELKIYLEMGYIKGRKFTIL